jgi:RND family efflux transporter MFP subunit
MSLEEAMSADPIKTPDKRRLRLIAAAASTVAVMIVAGGIYQRAQSAREVAQWTESTAVPTVALAKIDHGDTTRTLTLPGTIEAFSKAPIFARVTGYLKSWQADIGAPVKAGQVLATIDTPDLDQQFEQAKADLATAAANAQLAAVTASRYTALKSDFVSRQSIDNSTSAAAATKAAADAASANLKRLQALEDFKNIVAPFDGVVTTRKTDVGALINAGSGTELFEVSDLHRVRIYIQVPQAFSGEIQPGQRATFELPQYPGRQFIATVASISHALETNSRSMLVELQADNADGKLFAGAYAQVHVQLPSDPNVLRLPATALMPADQGVQVAVLGRDNKVTLKGVQLGRDFGDSAEIVSGLSPNDRVIDDPPETLETGDVVRLAGSGAQSTNT